MVPSMDDDGHLVGAAAVHGEVLFLHPGIFIGGADSDQSDREEQEKVQRQRPHESEDQERLEKAGKHPRFLPGIGRHWLGDDLGVQRSL
jgi:hypothetical protein